MALLLIRPNIHLLLVPLSSAECGAMRRLPVALCLFRGYGEYLLFVSEMIVSSCCICIHDVVNHPPRLIDSVYSELGFNKLK
jgi:hypothetical protein